MLLENSMTLPFKESSPKEGIPQFNNEKVSSLKKLNHMLDEGLSDIKAGRVIPAEVVNQRFHEKYGV